MSNLSSFASMIQRIQSIFMALCSVWAITMILVDPIYFTLLSSDNLYNLKGLGLFLSGDVAPQITSYPVIGVLALLGVLPIGAMLRFKNLKLQMKLMRLNMLLGLAFITLTVFYIDRSQILIGEETETTPSFWFLSSVMPIIFSVLAIRFMKKDENLLKAADRLR